MLTKDVLHLAQVEQLEQVDTLNKSSDGPEVEHLNKVKQLERIEHVNLCLGQVRFQVFLLVLRTIWKVPFANFSWTHLVLMRNSQKLLLLLLLPLLPLPPLEMC